MLVMPLAPRCENEKFMVICHPTEHHVRKLQPPLPSYFRRYIAIFLKGDFDKEEADNFFIDFIDEPEGRALDARLYFRNIDGMAVKSIGWSISLKEMLKKDDLGYIQDHFSVSEFVDKYTYYLASHIVHRALQTIVDEDTVVRF